MSFIMNNWIIIFICWIVFSVVILIGDKIGEIYEGNISSVTDSGIFVELDNTIEGFIYKEYLPDDRYIFDQPRYMLVGKRNKFMLGDRLSVKVSRVDMNTRHIDFEIANEQLKY